MSVYSALKDGVVVGTGTYQSKELLEMDYPSPEYTLVYGEVLELPVPAKTYADLRRVSYPPLADFTDAIYWQSQGDNSKMDAYLAKVEAVKLQYPKPTEDS